MQRTVARVFIPRRALLSFGLSAGGAGGGRGVVHVTLRSEGRVLGRKTLRPGEGTFRQTSIAFAGPGREAPLEVDLRLTDAESHVLPQPSTHPAAVTDPTLFDRDGIRSVVLVSIDTLRRDHVGAYGYSRPTTPRLDAWARGGVVVKDAVSVSSWTLPAHLSLLTSVEPVTHGGVDGHHGFNRAVPSLPETLRGAGFATHAITSSLYLSPAYGLDAGFDVFDYREDRSASEVADRALAALGALGGRPFFLFLHFYDPHWPYAAPEAERALFDAREAAALGATPPAENRPGDAGPLRDAYDAEIRYTDAHLGRVLDHLERTGLARHTLVVVTSDHGEEFGEHGGYEHLRTLYEEVVRVPLLMKGPRLSAAARDGAVSLMDVAPTVLDAVGLPKEPTHRGRSLLGPAVPGAEVYGETDMSGFDQGRRLRKLFLRGGERAGKLIVTLDRHGGEVLGEEWFDLAVDPGERSSLEPPAATADVWRSRLLERFRTAQRQSAPGPDVVLDHSAQERLRALGYVAR